jgi:hypothetical protein
MELDSLRACVSAVDGILRLLDDPSLAHAPGPQHWEQARRLLVEVRGELTAGLDSWQKTYPERCRS